MISHPQESFLIYIYDKKEIGVLLGKIPIKRYTYDAKTSIYNPYKIC